MICTQCVQSVENKMKKEKTIEIMVCDECGYEGIHKDVWKCDLCDHHCCRRCLVKIELGVDYINWNQSILHGHVCGECAEKITKWGEEAYPTLKYANK